MLRMYDILAKKREGKALSPEEIAFVVAGCTDGTIPDYQLSALLMAIAIQGMTLEETVCLTKAMAQSGEMVDLSSIPGVKVDKHSTGGVGDKTTLICGPLAAACGVKVAKMSGRGLGHTGGTVDKLEAIPGYRTQLSQREFFQTVERVGISLIGQSGNLAPADKKLYALRDVTATVSSLPLIASSIMSKKLAAGSDKILLDVKVGSGALLPDREQAAELARQMCFIGRQAGRETVALLTNMDLPLGRKIGNCLEVEEAAETLQGRGPEDLTRVSLKLAAEMICLAGLAAPEEAAELAQRALREGRAWEVFQNMIRAQGGDFTGEFPKAPCEKPVLAQSSGWIQQMDTEAVGTTSVLLGAGRLTKESAIDYGAGILLLKKTGERVEAGEKIALLYAENAQRIEAAEPVFLGSLTIGERPPEPCREICGRVTAEETVFF